MLQIEADAVFAALKPAFRKVAPRLVVQKDTGTDYSLVSKLPSPFPQHKGNPMWFGGVRKGKAYVSVHLMPLYMNDRLNAVIPADLKKRMQGQSCFNFKVVPDQETFDNLTLVIGAGLSAWEQMRYC